MNTYRYLRQKCPICIAAFLLINCGIFEAHVCDIHLRTPSELRLEEEAKKKKENTEARETLHNESTTTEEKKKALKTLAENGGMV